MDKQDRTKKSVVEFLEVDWNEALEILAEKSLREIIALFDEMNEEDMQYNRELAHEVFALLPHGSEIPYGTTFLETQQGEFVLSPAHTDFLSNWLTSIRWSVIPNHPSSEACRGVLADCPEAIVDALNAVNGLHSTLSQILSESGAEGWVAQSGRLSELMEEVWEFLEG